jgi:hypothetical protein
LMLLLLLLNIVAFDYCLAVYVTADDGEQLFGTGQHACISRRVLYES